MVTLEQSSFRDRDAFVFYIDGFVYRQINNSFKRHYDMLMESGLYAELLGKRLILEHEEVNVCSPRMESAYKVLMPAKVPFISYPYEWCFSQLKDTALLTLEIQMLSLEKGMSLKDASAYNVQFRGSEPVFIDTSSFEAYTEDRPWAAYGQFCRHFLAPLLLMAYKDERLVHLLKSFIDGIPLDFAAKLLPAGAALKPMVFMNIMMHSHYESKMSGRPDAAREAYLSKKRLYQLMESLSAFIYRLHRKAKHSEWADYVTDNTYSALAAASKKNIVEELLKKVLPRSVWDLGSNTGEYGRIAAQLGIETMSMDFDFETVEKNYLSCRAGRQKNILPLFIDILNPSPGIGWDNSERRMLKARENPDAIMALALIHHLSISGGITLEMAACFFRNLCRCLIIEFVPCSDKMVQRMLADGDFSGRIYTREDFELHFGRSFYIIGKYDIEDSDRSIYLMEGK